MASVTFVKILRISPKQSIRPMRCVIHNVLLSCYQENISEITNHSDVNKSLNQHIILNFSFDIK